MGPIYPTSARFNQAHIVTQVAEIVAVVETPKVYDVENTRTNKGIRLRVGTEEKVWRLEYISNQ